MREEQTREDYLREYQEHKEIREELESADKPEKSGGEEEAVQEAVFEQAPQEAALLEYEQEIPGVEFTLPTIDEMLEAGVHWGHQRKKWNPAMEPYVWGEHNRIHIIDLTKTLEGLKRAQQFAFKTVFSGRLILFVGTKRQIKDIIRNYAEQVQMPYVTERWLGGTLTNFITIRHTIRRLDEIEEMIRDGTIESMVKKERLMLMRQREKMLRLLGGIRKLTRLPAALYVVDTIEEEIAVKEANRLGIPVIAIVDTNSNPELVDYPIPANDDSARSVELITRHLVDAIAKARELRQKQKEGMRQRLEARAAVRAQRIQVRTRRFERGKQRTLRGRRPRR